MIFGLGGSSQRSSSKSESTSYGVDVSQSALSPEQLAMQQQLMAQFAPALNYGPGALAQGFATQLQRAPPVAVAARAFGLRYKLAGVLQPLSPQCANAAASRLGRAWTYSIC